ncbi:MAG: valine--tRNA ligase, partial [Deltaproteobacteria bacterium]|nr:valine--tRNA ligase [Deltaproteobacteria bacterium]
ARADGQQPPYCIVIPPPNITGSLHMGHALNNTLQDILIRFKRMQGYDTLWMPGTDHAGIATQNVVERMLAEEGLNRHDLGREAFIQRVWQWKETSGGTIITQLKRLGCSCDWSRERFTMDEGLSRAVREVFVRLYEEGLIYKGDYIINWCPRCQTALADLEVEHEAKEGYLYYIRYPLVGREGALTVATTRPETLLGDTAVAVNPEDERYQDFHGAMVRLPILGRKIPVITDSYVSMEFGTGALKVTPAHDFHDFEIARRHGLPAVKALDEHGIMTEEAGKYQGLDRFACREKILKDLKSDGLLEKVERYSYSIGHCYRCRTIVEPMISKQWFVAVKTLAEPAMAAVREGRIKLIPDTWENSFFDWMTNIRDWCISRQIWWGHRIPAWTCTDCGQETVSRQDPSTCPACGSPRLEQETDVLDTWFSSALWPFSTLGWPDDTPELKIFYPTSVLVTAFDILFFWVARMMMMGIHVMQDVPFREVYIHALVRDPEGRKMSKSRGNIIDPLDLMDTYGTDAFRFSLAAFAAMGRDIRLSEERIIGYRNFVNKVWNACRFTLMNQFIWHEFCDWYLELIKPNLAAGADPQVRQHTQRVLVETLGTILRLLHPFMPFITEEVWHKLPGAQGSIMVAPFPQPDVRLENPQAEAEIRLLMDTIIASRNLRAEMNVPASSRVENLLFCQANLPLELLARHSQDISRLARVSEVRFNPESGRPAASAATVVAIPDLIAGELEGEVKTLEIVLPLEGVIDFREEERRLNREMDKLSRDLAQAQKKLANEDFLTKAPAEVVEKEKERLQTCIEKLAKLKSHQQRLRQLMT